MSGLIFHLIPHTHWDREWYLPRAAFQARLLPALDDLIERLQTDAAHRSFLLDGQTVLVADYLTARPERKADIQTLVKTGRLQVGPWYVLADELIPSGEALVRNLLLGAADAEQLGGRLDVLYSPDAFGHPAAWPTLAREFGIRFGVVWRGLGGEPGQERDLYRWRGPEGRDVLFGTSRPGATSSGLRCPRMPTAWARCGRVSGRRSWSAPPGSTSPCSSAPTIMPLTPPCPACASCWLSSSRAARFECRGSMSSSSSLGKARNRRRSTGSCAGPTATPGRCKACTPPGRRSSGAPRRLSCPSSGSPSHWRRSRAAREVATGVPCSSWRGARSPAASSTMRSRGARSTT